MSWRFPVVSCPLVPLINYVRRDDPLTAKVTAEPPPILFSVSTGAQQVIEQCSTQINAVLQVVKEALLLCTEAHRLYLSATPDVRRQLNQTVFTRFWIINDQVQVLTSPHPSPSYSTLTWLTGSRPRLSANFSLALRLRIAVTGSQPAMRRRTGPRPLP
jgi:hypothetical protein